MVTTATRSVDPPKSTTKYRPLSSPVGDMLKLGNIVMAFSDNDALRSDKRSFECLLILSSVNLSLNDFIIKSSDGEVLNSSKLIESVLETGDERGDEKEDDGSDNE